MIVVSDEHASGGLQPRIQSLDLPPTPVTPDRSAVLRHWPEAITLVWRDEADPALGKISVQRITVVGLISNQPLGKLLGESTIERGVPDIVDDTSDKAGTGAVGLPTVHQSSVSRALRSTHPVDRATAARAHPLAVAARARKAQRVPTERR